MREQRIRKHITLVKVKGPIGALGLVEKLNEEEEEENRRWAWSRSRSSRRFILDEVPHPSYSSCHINPCLQTPSFARM